MSLGIRPYLNGDYHPAAIALLRVRTPFGTSAGGGGTAQVSRADPSVDPLAASSLLKDWYLSDAEAGAGNGARPCWEEDKTVLAWMENKVWCVTCFTAGKARRKGGLLGIGGCTCGGGGAMRWGRFGAVLVREIRCACFLTRRVKLFSSAGVCCWDTPTVWTVTPHLFTPSPPCPFIHIVPTFEQAGSIKGHMEQLRFGRVSTQVQKLVVMILTSVSTHQTRVSEPSAQIDLVRR